MCNLLTCDADSNIGNCKISRCKCIETSPRSSSGNSFKIYKYREETEKKRKKKNYLFIERKWSKVIYEKNEACNIDYSVYSILNDVIYRLNFSTFADLNELPFRVKLPRIWNSVSVKMEKFEPHSNFLCNNALEHGTAV